MRSSFSHLASLGWLATWRRPAPSADALTLGWWIEPNQPTAPEPTLRGIVMPPQPAGAL